MATMDTIIAVSSIETVQTLMCTELNRIERVMQEAGQSSVADTSGHGDQLLNSYLHIYTNLINGLASVEEVLQWLRRTG
jgi:hypothetical protein